MGFYDFTANNIFHEEIKMDIFKGKVVLIVNTASKCGFTPQFEDLEIIYKEYNPKGFEVLGFPCNQFANQDSGTNEEINGFCKLNYGVTFNMFEKIEVNGKNTHPLFDYLKSETKSLFGKRIKWNFTKFLIDSNGNVVKRYPPSLSPLEIRKDIESLLLDK